MLTRQCLRQRPPAPFTNPRYGFRKQSSCSISSSLPSQQEKAPQRPIIPPKWPTRQPATDSSPASETPSAAPLREIISMLTTKSAIKRNEKMTISAFTPTTAKLFYSQGPKFKPPIGTIWDPDRRVWRRYQLISKQNRKLRRHLWLRFAKPKKPA